MQLYQQSFLEASEEQVLASEYGERVRCPRQETASQS
jgi:hypothetical protein